MNAEPICDLRWWMRSPSVIWGDECGAHLWFEVMNAEPICDLRWWMRSPSVIWGDECGAHLWFEVMNAEPICDLRWWMRSPSVIWGNECGAHLWFEAMNAEPFCELRWWMRSPYVIWGDECWAHLWFEAMNAEPICDLGRWMWSPYVIWGNECGAHLCLWKKLQAYQHNSKVQLCKTACSTHQRHVHTFCQHILLSTSRFPQVSTCLTHRLIIIIIIAFKGAIWDFLQYPHSAANCLQHVRSSGPGTCNTSSAYHVQASCYVPLGAKGQLSY